MNDKAIEKLPPPEQETPSAERLIALAIERQVPVETLERLFALRAQIRAEQAKAAFVVSLALFQATCPAITKSKAVKNSDDSIRYKYAPFNEIAKQIGPTLSVQGLTYTFDTMIADGMFTTICTITHVDGHSQTNRFSVPISNTNNMNALQHMGESDTYAKRYALCGALGLTADEDTDANSAPVRVDPPKNGQNHAEAPKRTATRKSDAASGPASNDSWFAFLKVCGAEKTRIGTAAYYAVLGDCGYAHANEVKRARSEMERVYNALKMAKKEE